MGAVLAASAFFYTSFLSADSFDWRNVGSVNWNTPAKNQFGGTCWAHGPTSSVEAKYMLSRNDTSFVPDLSEQQLCWETDPDLGSTQGGGGFDPMLNYYMNHGVVADSVVPVDWNHPENWDAPPAGTPVHPADYASRCWRITNWARITDNSTANLKAMLKANGPLVFGFNASDMYNSVAELKANYMPHANGDNHSVSLVGYYDDPTCPTGGYWVIKNSWGASGDNGFYYVPFSSSLEGCNHLYAITGSAYYTGAMASATWKGGSNTWSSQGTNWTNNSGGATYSWENKETNATFNVSAGTAVTVSGKVIAHGLTFSSGATGYSFSSGAPTDSSLTITAGGVTANESVTFNTPVYIGGPQTWNAVDAGETITVNGPLHTIISDLTISGAGNVVIAGPIDGGGIANFDGPGTSHGTAKPGGIIKANTGSLTFTGVSNYGGDITVNSGTLALTPSGSSSYSGAFFGNGTLGINSPGIVSIGGGASNFTGTINVLGGTLQFIPASGVTGLFAGKIASGSNPIVQNGPGATRLTFANSYTGSTTITSGALQAKDGVGLPAASMLILNGGVFQSEGSSSVTFTRALNSTPGVNNRFYWANGGGFSAGSANMTVRINGGAGTLTWGTNQGSEIVGTLALSSSTAAAITDFQNAIDLNGDVRTVQVDDNPNTTADYAQISSSITGSGASAFTKTGNGLLKLTGANNYPGTTTIAGGILQATIGATGIPAGSFISLDGGVLQFDGNSISSVTRSLGTSGGTNFQWGLGGGGFSAGTTPLTVSVGGAATPTPLVWGSTSADVGTKLVGPLTLNATTASSSLTFKNSIDLAGGSRSIYSGANTVYLQGGMSDSIGGASLTKSGTATLYLNGAGSSYTGATSILGGDLYLNTTSGYAIPGDLVLGGNSGFNVYVQGNNQIAPTSKWTWKATAGWQEIQLLGHSQTVAGLCDGTSYGVVENTWGSGYSPITLTINNSTNCWFNGYLRNNASGSAGAVSLVKTGTGTQTLAGGNIRYTGGTTISGGKLIFQDLTSTSFSARAVTNNSVLGLNAVNNEFAFSGVISGTGSVEIAGGNKLTLNGSSGNSYSGVTKISAGTVILAKTAGYAIPGDFTISNANTFVVVQNANQFPATAKVTFNGTGDPHFSIYGHTVTVGGIIGSAGGAVQNAEGETGPGNGTLIVDNTSNCSYSGIIRDNAGGSGTFELVKNGTGILTLVGGYSGNYTGGLTVNNGTLNYSGGSLPNCDYTITGGTLNIGGLIKSIGSFKITGGTVSATTIKGVPGTLSSNTAYDIQAGTVVARLSGTDIALNKTGSGTAILSATNNYSGPTTISGGVLQANSSAGLSYYSYLKLDGGVLQSNGTSPINFIRALASTATLNTFEWTANGGGFAAGTTPLYVKIANSTAAVNWADTEGANIAGILKLSSNTAANVVDFQSGINLNGNIRTIQVDDNPLTANDSAKISGSIADGSGPGGIIKTGPGLLTLSGPLSYTGNTAINGGMLQINSTAATLTTITGTGILSIGRDTHLTATSIQVDTLNIGVTPGLAAVPEPSMLILLFGMAITGLLLRKRMR
jgi:autotransporter-associated beta strand protein